MTDTIVEVVIPGDINIVEVVTQPTTEVLEVIVPGPRGTPGLSGSGEPIEFVQSIPSTVWTWQHSLGYDPIAVAVIDSNGDWRDEFIIQYLVPGQTLRLSFDQAISGIARSH